jgi:hypothetical protein
MVKKIVKLVLAVLMILGVAIAVFNTFDTELQSAPGTWREFMEDIPDCVGKGATCYDFTSPTPN